MITGVATKTLQVHADERGAVMEILRSDDEIFDRFGQTYVALNYPGVVRAWHYHKKQTDFFAAVKGMVKVVLYDPRPESSTCGEINEFFLGERSNLLLKIPPDVVHGYKTVGVEPSLLLNFPTEPYSRQEPDEYRFPWNAPEIPYDWDIKFK